MKSRQNRAAWTSLFVILCGLALFATSPARAGEPETGPEYTIGVGDIIEVLVWKEADLSRVGRVRLDGRVSLPLVGDVMAAGMTTRALSAFLQDKLKEYITDPSVTVILAENHSRMYYVIGQIAKAGEYPIDYPITLLQAIARAGGFQEWAKKANITIARRGEGKPLFLTFDYDAFTRGENLDKNIEIAPGDTIIIP